MKGVTAPLTPAIIYAIATDAANAQMRKAGRRKWSRADYSLAVRTQAQLLRHTGETHSARTP